MKQALRALFSPLLNALESGESAYTYKPSHRKILIFISLVFTALALLVMAMNPGDDMGYSFPVLVFGLLGLLGLVVGTLGNDRAVAAIWGNR